MILLDALLPRRARGPQLWLALCLALGLLVMGSAPAKAWGPTEARASAAAAVTGLNVTDELAFWTVLAADEAAAGDTTGGTADTSVTGAEPGDGVEAPELGLPPSGLQVSAASLLMRNAKVPRLLDTPWLEGLQRPPRPRGG